MGSRGIYHEGWFASTFGPRTPWVTDLSGLTSWDPQQDRWELFNTRQDFTLARDLAEEQSAKVVEMKDLFMREAVANKVLPIGGGLFTPLNPHESKRSTNTEWALYSGMIRIPESQAPNVRNGNIRAEIEIEAPAGASGVIFAMGGYAGGVSLYAYEGELRYEYSALLLKRDKINIGSLPAGRVNIEFEMRTPFERAAPAEVTFWINGKKAATGTVERTVPATFTAAETFDVGLDTASPVADDYFDQAPFAFNGVIEYLHFQQIFRVVDPANRFDQAFNHIALIVNRKLDRNMGPIPGGNVLIKCRFDFLMFFDSLRIFKAVNQHEKPAIHAVG